MFIGGKKIEEPKKGPFFMPEMNEYYNKEVLPQKKKVADKGKVKTKTPGEEQMGAHEDLKKIEQKKSGEGIGLHTKVVTGLGKKERVRVPDHTVEIGDKIADDADKRAEDGKRHALASIGQKVPKEKLQKEVAKTEAEPTRAAKEAPKRTPAEEAALREHIKSLRNIGEARSVFEKEKVVQKPKKEAKPVEEKRTPGLDEKLAWVESIGEQGKVMSEDFDRKMAKRDEEQIKIAERREVEGYLRMLKDISNLPDSFETSTTKWVAGGEEVEDEVSLAQMAAAEKVEGPKPGEAMKVAVAEMEKNPPQIPDMQYPKGKMSVFHPERHDESVIQRIAKADPEFAKENLPVGTAGSGNTAIRIAEHRVQTYKEVASKEEGVKFIREMYDRGYEGWELILYIDRDKPGSPFRYLVASPEGMDEIRQLLMENEGEQVFVIMQDVEI